MGNGELVGIGSWKDRGHHGCGNLPLFSLSFFLSFFLFFPLLRERGRFIPSQENLRELGGNVGEGWVR